MEKFLKMAAVALVVVLGSIALAACEPSDASSDVDDMDKVEAAMSTLAVASTATADLELVTRHANGTDITWISSRADVISATGDVTRQHDDVEVELTAILEYGDAMDAKSFDVTVTGDSTVEDWEEMYGQESTANDRLEGELATATTIGGAQLILYQTGEVYVQFTIGADVDFATDSITVSFISDDLTIEKENWVGMWYKVDTTSGIALVNIPGTADEQTGGLYDETVIEAGTRLSHYIADLFTDAEYGNGDPKGFGSDFEGDITISVEVKIGNKTHTVEKTFEDFVA